MVSRNEGGKREHRKGKGNSKKSGRKRERRQMRKEWVIRELEGKR